MKGVKCNWEYLPCLEHHETGTQYAESVKHQVNRIFIGSTDLIDLRGRSPRDAQKIVYRINAKKEKYFITWTEDSYTLLVKRIK